MTHAGKLTGSLLIRAEPSKAHFSGKVLFDLFRDQMCPLKLTAVNLVAIRPLLFRVKEPTAVQSTDDGVPARHLGIPSKGECNS